jgi:glutamyl-tRNA reductase
MRVKCDRCNLEKTESHNCMDALKHRVIQLELSLGKRIKSESEAHSRRLSTESVADELYSALLNVTINYNIEDDFAIEAIGSYNMYN